MSKQFILCFESDSRAKTDFKYVNSVLKKYYSLKENKITPIYMNGKYNYNSSDVLRKIDKCKKDYSGDTDIIYFFDTDDYAVHPDDNNFCLSAARFCRDKGYQVIWFVETVEVVFHGQKVSKKEKTKKSDDFIRKGKIENIDLSNLIISEPKATKTSNIMFILDQKLQRKR